MRTTPASPASLIEAQTARTAIQNSGKKQSPLLDRQSLFPISSALAQTSEVSLFSYLVVHKFIWLNVLGLVTKHTTRFFCPQGNLTLDPGNETFFFFCKPGPLKPTDAPQHGQQSTNAKPKSSHARLHYRA